MFVHIFLVFWFLAVFFFKDCHDPFERKLLSMAYSNSNIRCHFPAIVTSLNSRFDNSSNVVPSGIFPPASSLATFDMHTAPTAAMVDRCSLLAMYVVSLDSNFSISGLSVIVCI